MRWIRWLRHVAWLVDCFGVAFAVEALIKESMLHHLERESQ